MNATTLDFFFDLSSPWTFLAFNNVQPILAETGAQVRWRPFLVGGVFNAVNPRVYEMRADPEQKAMKRSFGWLREWAQLAGLPMNFPSPHHPVKSVNAMRCCCALQDDQATLFRFADAAFTAYFGEARNIDDPAELAAIADAIGLDGAALLGRAGEQAVKDALRANTEEAIARGAFGSPTLFVQRAEGGEAMYFGNDQLPLVRQALVAAAG
ncbi:2-hydroxychromene-2-carboxylate isomerase [Novosphingobium huizhouense]|uniref:2-hydroxychromene-2-carboxylate isomerase n=1 Tax=Novosphingobium huizhouense TaxID=2866625 RepID=UPI001CD9178D|nr:2-hydroxychromene-2-carboxylate isomerase [Novosphingobium huizhouense]